MFTLRKFWKLFVVIVAVVLAMAMPVFAQEATLEVVISPAKSRIMHAGETWELPKSADDAMFAAPKGGAATVEVDGKAANLTDEAIPAVGRRIKVVSGEVYIWSTKGKYTIKGWEAGVNPPLPKMGYAPDLQATPPPAENEPTPIPTRVPTTTPVPTPKPAPPTPLPTAKVPSAEEIVAALKTDPQFLTNVGAFVDTNSVAGILMSDSGFLGKVKGLPGKDGKDGIQGPPGKDAPTPGWNLAGVILFLMAVVGGALGFLGFGWGIEARRTSQKAERDAAQTFQISRSMDEALSAIRAEVRGAVATADGAKTAVDALNPTLAALQNAFGALTRSSDGAVQSNAELARMVAGFQEWVTNLRAEVREKATLAEVTALIEEARRQLTLDAGVNLDTLEARVRADLEAKIAAARQESKTADAQVDTEIDFALEDQWQQIMAKMIELLADKADAAAIPDVRNELTKAVADALGRFRQEMEQRLTPVQDGLAETKAMLAKLEPQPAIKKGRSPFWFCPKCGKPVGRKPDENGKFRCTKCDEEYLPPVEATPAEAPETVAPAEQASPATSVPEAAPGEQEPAAVAPETAPRIV